MPVMVTGRDCVEWPVFCGIQRITMSSPCPFESRRDERGQPKGVLFNRVEASVPDSIGFGDIAKMNSIEMTASKRTESLGTIMVSLGNVGDRGLCLPVSLDLSRVIYNDEVQNAIVSALSNRTQLLLDIE